MNILVLGGTGAMGRPIVKILADRGENVFVTSRSTKKSENNIEYITGNAHDKTFIEKLLNERHYEAIIDFMVYSSNEFEERYDMFCKNTEQYVFFSSSRVYADSSDAPIIEESPRLLDACKDEEYLKTDEYALSKAREENILLNSKYKNYTIIRPYITYFDNRLQLGVYEKETWLQRALNGKKIVFSQDVAEKYTTLTYAHDVSLRIADLIGKKEAFGEVFHIASGVPVKWENVLEIYLNALEKYTGKRPEVFMTEKFEPFIAKNNTYQLKYDRLFDRKFNPTKINNVYGRIDEFVLPEIGLDNCVKNFIQNKETFLYKNWLHEGVLDKISGDKENIFKIPGWKNQIKYILGKYFWFVAKYI